VKGFVLVRDDENAELNETKDWFGRRFPKEGKDKEPFLP
jgi:hypothetical protein